MPKPLPDGIDPFLAPNGGWKIASITVHGSELTIQYRCVKCRAIHNEKSEFCPSCNEPMKYQSEEDDVVESN